VVIANAQEKNEATFKERFDSLEEKMAMDFRKISEQLASSYAMTVQNESKESIQANNQSTDVVHDDVIEAIDSNTILSKKNIWIGTLMLLLYIYSRGG